MVDETKVVLSHKQGKYLQIDERDKWVDRYDEHFLIEYTQIYLNMLKYFLIEYTQIYLNMLKYFLIEYTQIYLNMFKYFLIK